MEGSGGSTLPGGVGKCNGNLHFRKGRWSVFDQVEIGDRGRGSPGLNGWYTNACTRYHILKKSV